MTGPRMRSILCSLAICVIVNSLFLGIVYFDGTIKPNLTSEQVNDTDPSRNYLPDDNVNDFDYWNQLEAYKDYSDSIIHHTLTENFGSGNGFDVVYEITGSKLTIRVVIDKYSIVSYSFDEGNYQSLMIPGTQLSSHYGYPVLPYRNILIAIPSFADVVEIDYRTIKSESVSALDLVPAPKPLALYEGMIKDTSLFFNQEAYSSDIFSPDEIIEYQEVKQRDEEGLLFSINPLQYNPVMNEGLLHNEMAIEITFDSPISNDDLIFNGGSNGYNYTMIIAPEFESAVSDFVDWKITLGYDVYVETLDDIYATYSGNDEAEMIRNFINDSYTTNGTDYVFIIGDGDVVPVRMVFDPADAGQGLDNGTEPTDLYYECLDGNWDLNGNQIYGEMDDGVDLFPELMVGRIPVQTPGEAEHVLLQIISYESNPVPGNWMNDFMLIANECFGSGDGPVMSEGIINQKYLYDSFYDVFRYYSTDGSLNTVDIVSKMNSGIGIVDFFDHGAYDTWVGALDVIDVLGLSNGNKSMFAFAMACETAAFDYEAGEPTIAEAFFKNPNGGAAAYIGATRIAWAGYDVFDGFHNVYWDHFLTDALVEREAHPKAAFHSALNHMVTTFDMTAGPPLETVYQAIYFGDPSMRLYWKQNITTEASIVEVQETIELNGTCLSYNDVPLVGSVDVTVIDPLGTTVYSGTTSTDTAGFYSVTFDASEHAGDYRVQTQVSSPFTYAGETTFSVGTLDATLQLDSDPVYNTFLSFSGTANADCAGNATLIDSLDSVVDSVSFTVSGGVFSSSINLTAFGDLRLYVQLDNGTTNAGVESSFRVNRGDILVIADDTGAWGPYYPGGWADDNFGDSSNQGDYALALKSEYNVTVFYPMFEQVPPVSLLHEYDAVVVTTGDNFGMPLTSPDSYLIDVLMDYHNTGGHLLIEGSAILTSLAYNGSIIFSNLFHVDYIEGTTNDGAIELVKGIHPIMNGLPTSIVLENGLGTEVVDVFNPDSGSVSAAEYGGSYVGVGSAITGFSPFAGLGGVVFIGFSIDGISNQDDRNLLIQNAIAFLLHPTLLVSVSDDALQTGTTEMIYFEVTDAATGTPIADAEVNLAGCGVTAVNTTQPDGTCSILINPTSAGVIAIDVTKGGYLNYSSEIIVYDMPIIALSASPAFLEPYTTQVVTITATDYYEHFPLVGCYVNATGLGNSVDGFTNSSGMVELTLTPNDGGQILVNGTLSGYVSTVIGLPVRLSVVV
ncbi:MAG: C25 family cysteine peptidase, partial [Candidatus Thorarchaeota archaeon]